MPAPNSVTRRPPVENHLPNPNAKERCEEASSDDGESQYAKKPGHARGGSRRRVDHRRRLNVAECLQERIGHCESETLLGGDGETDEQSYERLGDDRQDGEAPRPRVTSSRPAW